MTKSFKAFALAAAASASIVAAAPTAQAATVFASSVAEYVEGAGIVSPARRITDNALGAPDGAFLSLGLGGSAVFDFGTAFRTSVTLTEVTFGNRAGHVESALVYGLQVLGGPATLLGAITNSTSSVTLAFDGVFQLLQVVDTSPALRGRDGFDIDAISVVAVPLPAAGGLLALGLIGGAAMLRRRKRA
jgi:hypothetical protein